LVTATTCGMLQLAAQASDSSSSPGEILKQVNEALLVRIPPNMFVTCFYALLDPESGRLLYANAGHDLPYLWHGNGDAEELRVRGMPLGLMPGMEYEEKEIVLDAGQSVLFYSDGLVERPTILKVRCSASLGFRRSSPSMARRNRWWTHFSRSSTPSLERARSRRTISL
jgi:serine phosphatase RsbU (regulator of sigma subunit)